MAERNEWIAIMRNLNAWLGLVSDQVVHVPRKLFCSISFHDRVNVFSLDYEIVVKLIVSYQRSQYWVLSIQPKTPELSKQEKNDTEISLESSRKIRKLYFPKCEPLNWKFMVENQMEQKLPVHFFFEDLGTSSRGCPFFLEFCGIFRILVT